MDLTELDNFEKSVLFFTYPWLEVLTRSWCQTWRSSWVGLLEDRALDLVQIDQEDTDLLQPTDKQSEEYISVASYR